MKAKLAKLCCIGLICLFAVGLILLVAAPSFGEGAGQRAIEANGGVMDTATYQRAITTTTDTYRACGQVLALVGGMGGVLFGYGVLLFSSESAIQEKRILGGKG